MTRIYLVRHPETKRNINDKLTGWENTHYTKLGLQQFEDIVRFFKAIKLPIFSSDLSRAKRLAEAISKKNKMPICFSKNLRERNFKETRPHSSSETKKEFGQRIGRFFKRHSKERGIIVSHAGTINEIKKFYKEFVINEKKVLERVTLLKLREEKSKKKEIKSQKG